MGGTRISHHVVHPGRHAGHCLRPAGRTCRRAADRLPPDHPTFGGDAFNSSHLLATAQAQNPYKERDEYRDRSEADLFAQQLQSRLLSALAGQLTEAIFGDNPQDSGTFTFGDQTVAFVRGLDAVNLTITNTATGATTTISIPSYVQLP